MKKFIIILAVLLLALFLRPDFDAHKQKINTHFSEENPIPGALGGGKVVANLVDYNNYYLFSYTTIQDKMVSFGIFRIVFITKTMDIDEYINEHVQ